MQIDGFRTKQWKEEWSEEAKEIELEPLKTYVH